MNQVIQLDGILSNVQNDEVQVYSSNTLLSVVDQYSNSILSTTTFDDTSKVYINVVQPLYLNSVLQAVVNDEVQVYSSNTIQEIQDRFDYSIVSQNEFNVTFTHNVTTYLDSIDSSSVISNSKLNYVIFLNSLESTTIFESDAKLSTIIYADDIQTNVQFDTSKLNFKLYPESIETSSAFETDYGYNFKMYASDITSTSAFGDFTQLNMEIENVPFPSIESTLIISTPNVIKVIGPLSLAPTISFGTSSFIDNIHRILVFKNDNISKIGENDAAVIAGGIRLNPSSTASNTASSGSADLPTNPVGFLSVNIGGVDYKIPYYNS